MTPTVTKTEIDAQLPHATDFERRVYQALLELTDQHGSADFAAVAARSGSRSEDMARDALDALRRLGVALRCDDGRYCTLVDFGDGTFVAPADRTTRIHQDRIVSLDELHQLVADALLAETSALGSGAQEWQTAFDAADRLHRETGGERARKLRVACSWRQSAAEEVARGLALAEADGNAQG